MDYRADGIRDALDLMAVGMAGPPPVFDRVTSDFLRQSHADLQARANPNALVTWSSLGEHVPWLFRLDYKVRGLAVGAAPGEVVPIERQSVLLRFQPDYLRSANKFEMLRLLEPVNPPLFHPNVHPVLRLLCVEIYPGEPLLEIVESLYELFRWRLRQYDERDALNPDACAWGREHAPKPLDDRPLWGRRLQLRLDPVENKP